MYLRNWGMQGGNRKGLSRQVYCNQFLNDVNISVLGANIFLQQVCSSPFWVLLRPDGAGMGKEDM